MKAQDQAATFSTPNSAPDQARAPGPLLMLMEARAPWEAAALLAAAPWLSRLPPGDGHPVLVFPGLAASDLSTLPLRRFLRRRGHWTHSWRQGFNFGPRNGVLQACRGRVQQLAERHGCKVSLVGWSLGGVYARELAKELPHLTRCVITLGSPFAGHPRATNAWRVYEWLSGQSVHDNHEMHRQLREAPPVPTTSILSRSDGVVAWHCSVNEPRAHTENIEIAASHVGMGVNPLALYAVADRLRQDPERWQRFDVSGARRWFFRHTAASRAAGA
ncbi:MAG: alpha/beta hydrolase [Burkholderiaceae bacterium]|nr:alpha/beta hydrolase [Burkholderiaceae bacterium]